MVLSQSSAGWYFNSLIHFSAVSSSRSLKRTSLGARQTTAPPYTSLSYQSHVVLKNMYLSREGLGSIFQFNGAIPAAKNTIPTTPLKPLFLHSGCLNPSMALEPSHPPAECATMRTSFSGWDAMRPSLRSLQLAGEYRREKMEAALPKSQAQRRF